MSEGKRFNLAFFLLLSFFLSFPLRMEDTFQWLRLKKINLNLFSSARMEIEALDLLKNDIWRFWPLFWVIKDGFCDEMERREPVNMRIELHKSGVSITPAPLKVASNFYWNGVMWYLSDSGKVWSEKHPVNMELYPDVKSFPEIIIDDSMADPFKGEEAVKQFNYSLDSFVNYIKLIVSSPWIGKVQSITFLKKGGVKQVAVRVKWGKKEFTVLLNRKTSAQNKIIAVSDLLQKGIILKSNTVFDATYDDKVIIRRVVNLM